MFRRALLVGLCASAWACTGMAGGGDVSPRERPSTDGRAPLGHRDAGDASMTGRAQLGETCAAPGDCASGVCVDVGSERRCSTRCDASTTCLAGWSCGDTSEGEFTEHVCRCNATEERCNDRDDDCDGAVDEGAGDCCTPGDSEPCGEGYCEPGEHTCDANGTWGECRGGRPGEPEVCDGLDNDCDPSTRDGAQEITYGASCALPSCTGEGCEGTTSCEGGLLVCTRNVPPPRVLRSVTITPAAIVERTEVKVVLVIDNSESMAEEQSRMAMGFRSMLGSLEDIENLDLEFFLYTTDGKPIWTRDKPTAYRVSSLVWDSDRMEHDSEPPDHSPYTQHQEFPLNPPYNGGARLRFTSDMTAVDRAARVEQLIGAITAIGTAGADQESGLCTMSHTIVGMGENAFLNEGDHVAFILLSDADEDDVDFFCQGVQTVHNVWDEDAGTGFTDDPREAFQSTYYLERLQYDYYYTATWTDPETGEMGSGENWQPPQALVPSEWGLSNTCPSTDLACPSSLVNHIESTTGRDVTRCKIDCERDYIRGFQSTDFDLTRSYCTTAYTVDGVRYANLEADATARGMAFIPGTCSALHWAHHGSWTSDWTESFDSYHLLPPHREGLREGTLEERLRGALPDWFGANRYFVSAIIHHESVSDAACAASSEGVGERYSDFVDSLGSRGYKQSICDTDYSPSTRRLADFVTGSLERAFEVDLALMGEAVGRVFIVHPDGSEDEVPQDELFVDGDEISIDASISIEPGDVVRVEITEA